MEVGGEDTFLVLIKLGTRLNPLMTIETYSVPKEKHHKIPAQTAVLRYIQNLCY